ncbi:MAG: hypothetical protein JSS68_09190 [Actinobacteria bacterium]|nr:hypothetical protein [Actinomycetota bacterium]MBS1885028.1 hypothetical protein [Actinomycetota bacterium]
MDPVTRVSQAIEERLAEIREEEEKLGRALVHLRGPSSGGPRPRKPAGRRRQAKRGQRGREVVEDVQAHPGSKPADTASRIGISANQASGIYIRLRKAGRLKGATRGGYVVVG